MVGLSRTVRNYAWRGAPLPEVRTEQHRDNRHANRQAMAKAAAKWNTTKRREKKHVAKAGGPASVRLDKYADRLTADPRKAGRWETFRDGDKWAYRASVPERFRANFEQYVFAGPGRQQTA